MRRSTLAALLVSLAAAPLSAQVCLGNSSFAAGRARVGAHYIDGSGANVYGLSGAYGRANGAFASAEVQHDAPRNLPDGVSSSSNAVVGAFDTELKPASLGGLSLCPLASLAYARGSTSGPLTDRSGQRGIFDSNAHGYIWGLGGAAGFATAVSPTVNMMPSLEVDYRSTRTSGSSTINGVRSDFSSRVAAYGYWVASLGFGHEAWTVAPTVERAFAVAHSAAVWGIRLSYNFNLSR